MGQFSKVLLAIDNAQRALDCRPGLGGLNQVYDISYYVGFIYE